MAVLSCLDHRAVVQATSFDAYAWPAQDLRCGVAGCRKSLVIWLDPGELHEYERGTRIFWEAGSFTKVRVDHRPLESLDPTRALPAAPALPWFHSTRTRRHRIG